MSSITTEPQKKSDKDKTIQRWQIFSMITVVLFTLFVASERGFAPSLSEPKEDLSVKEEINQPKDEVNDETATIDRNLPEVIPAGIPSVYGEDLGISYDDVSPRNPQKANETIAVMAQIDKTVNLSGDDLQRYINILYDMHGGMSCEFCCGARSVIFENGRAACGCAHSYAMRGIAKYLILNTDVSDEEIFEEVGKWKILFFPDIHIRKAEIMKEQEIEVDYISLTSNANRGIETGSSGEMVGGC